MTSRYVILDRDGVINHESRDFIRHAGEWHPIDGSLAAMADLTRAGWRIVVITNQSGVGRGLYDFQDLAGIHAKLRRQLAEAGGSVDALLMCPHHPDTGCHCRKPRPGLFEEAAALIGRPLRGIPAIGDTLRDLQAARDAGADPVLVRTGNGEQTLNRLADGEDRFDDLPVYTNLAEAVAALIQTAAPIPET